MSVLLLLALTFSSADDVATTQAKAAFAAGRAKYDLGYFSEALAEFERAYESRPLPAFLFNIGQCHFQEGRFDRAVFFYERYLELSPDAPDAALARELIVEARARAEAVRPPDPRRDATHTSPTNATPPRATPAPTTAAATNAAPAPASTAGASTPSSAPASEPASALPSAPASAGDSDVWLWTGVAVGATALVAIVAGAAWAVSTQVPQTSLGVVDGRSP